MLVVRGNNDQTNSKETKYKNLNGPAIAYIEIAPLAAPIKRIPRLPNLSMMTKAQKRAPTVLTIPKIPVVKREVDVPVIPKLATKLRV